jgi:two-component system NarL family response regulator
MMPTTVLLADDHKILCGALRLVLEQDGKFKVIGEAHDGRSAVKLAEELEPDIVVTDISMPELNGIEATRQITAARPEIKVIALTTYSDKRYVLAILQAGAIGYVVKANACSDLLKAVDAARRGQTYLSAEVAGAVITALITRETSTAARRGALTAREREVLQLLAEGAVSKTIATRLNISTRTVEGHRQQIMRKLQLHSIADLTKYAIREGLTTLEQ